MWISILNIILIELNERYSNSASTLLLSSLLSTGFLRESIHNLMMDAALVILVVGTLEPCHYDSTIS
jgi:hypothetical protein